MVRVALLLAGKNMLAASGSDDKDISSRVSKLLTVTGDALRHTKEARTPRSKH